MTKARRPRSLCIALCAALAACGTPPRHSPPRPANTARPTTAPAASSPATNSIEAPRPAPQPVACRPSLPEPQGPVAAGPAYVLVDHVGVLRIDEGKAATILKFPSGSSSWGTDITSGPAGDLWISDWSGVRVVNPDGSVRDIPLPKGGPRYEHLAIRASDDVWAITRDIEWSVVRHDGARWTTVRKRSQFPGRYDDNKIISLKVTREAVWVSCWNGLWRGVGNQWQKVELPDKYEGLLNLFVYRDRLIAGNHEGYFIQEGKGWKRLSWPVNARANRAVGDVGLVASPSVAGANVMLAPALGDGCTAVSDNVQGRAVHDLAVDQSGRVWVATDHSLAVLDRSGRILHQWAPGTLDGFVGEARRVVVIGAGPGNLPPAQPARTWEIIGRLEVYKSGAPLANADLELCTGSGDCVGAPFSIKATSAADGSFRFTGVPEAELQLHVRPPASEAGCGGIFTETGTSIMPARDCRAPPGAPRVCDLGTVRQCLPFEMPPPPP